MNQGLLRRLLAEGKAGAREENGNNIPLLFIMCQSLYLFQLTQSPYNGDSICPFYG